MIRKLAYSTIAFFLVVQSPNLLAATFSGSLQSCPVQEVSNSPIPLSLSGGCTSPPAFTTGRISASGSGVGASTTTSNPGGPQTGIVAGAGYQDIITFSKTDPSAPDNFNVSLNLRFAGALSFQDSASAGYTLTVLGTFGTFRGEGNASSQSVRALDSGLGETAFVKTTSNSLTIDALVTTPSVSQTFLGSNGTVTAFLTLAVTAVTSGSDGSATADLGHTLGFPIGSNVFNLPPGITANAGDYLVDNRIVDANSAVPVPGSWIAMATGLGLLGAMLRRRRTAA